MASLKANAAWSLASPLGVTHNALLCGELVNCWKAGCKKKSSPMLFDLKFHHKGP